MVSNGFQQVRARLVRRVVVGHVGDVGRLVGLEGVDESQASFAVWAVEGPKCAVHAVGHAGKFRE